MHLSTAAYRRWWPLLAGAAVGLAAGAALLASTPTSYAAQTVLFLGSPVSTDSAGAYAGDLFSQQRAATYAEMFGSDDLAVKVIDDLSLPLTPAALVAEVSAKQVPKTVLLQVSVADPSAQWAADIANAYATNFAGYVARLETPSTSAQSNAAITVVQKATVPGAPAAPSKAIDLGGGLVAGLVLGGAAVWARRRLDRSVTDAAQVRAATGADVLAELPAGRRRSALNPAADGTSGYAEALRALRTNLSYLDVDHPPTVLLLAGPAAADASTATVVDLAVLCGELGRKTLVVDGDLRAPAVAGYLGVGDGPGLSRVLSGVATAAEATAETAHPHLCALPAGPVPADPSELLAAEQMAKLLDGLRAEYDLVLFDAPAVLSVTDAAVLGAQVDGVLLLARAGRTSVAQLTDAATALRRVGARLLGTVLTREH